MAGPLFSQSAWDNVTFTGAEVENPGRNLPRALIIGCVIVVGLYLLANLAYVVTLSLPALQNAPNGRVATAVMEQIFGAPGVIIIAIALMISTFGCNNGLILSGSRVSYAMAKDGFLFALARQNKPQTRSGDGVLAQGIWASLLVLPRTVTYAEGSTAPVFGNVYTQLLEYIVSVDLISAALSVLAVIVLRRKMPEMEPALSNAGLSGDAGDFPYPFAFCNADIGLPCTDNGRHRLSAGPLRNSGLFYLAAQAKSDLI